METEGAFPVGLHIEGNGDVLMIDDQGMLYFLDPENGTARQKAILYATLRPFPTLLPLRQAVVGRGIGPDGGDQFFLSAPNQRDHHLLLFSRTQFGAFADVSNSSLNPLDGDIGEGKGQTLIPVALAYDSQRVRLLVLEAQGRLQVKLQGTVSNRSAIGARVVAITGTKRQRWDVDGGSGFCSQPSLPVEFGFGATTLVDSLLIRWPSGIVQTFTDLETNQRIAITEDNPLITAVEEESEGCPRTYSLSQNFPNPFNPQTTIHYQVPETGEIRLGIFNLAGQEVRNLAQGAHLPGKYSAVWDGTDAAGRAVASGVYVYRLEVVGRGVVETKRMALVR